MIYTLSNGQSFDTNKDLDFEERNFLQKMMIYAHLGYTLEEFEAKWRGEGNPVWRGQGALRSPTPAMRILLDIERKIKTGD